MLICVTMQFCSAGISFLLSIGCLSHALFNSIVTAFLTFLSSHHAIYRLKVYPKISSQTVKIFFFSCLLSTFAFFFLTLAPVFPLPSKHLPANTSTHTEREKKRQPFLHSPGSDSLKNLHWHTGVDCIVSPMQTRCEALMYGSTFFFLQRKTNVGQKCSSFDTQRYKNKFTFIPNFPSWWLGQHCVI